MIISNIWVPDVSFLMQGLAAEMVPFLLALSGFICFSIVSLVLVNSCTFGAVPNVDDLLVLYHLDWLG